MYGGADDSPGGVFRRGVYPQWLDVQSARCRCRDAYVHALLRCSPAFGVCGEGWAMGALLRLLVCVASVHAIGGLRYSGGGVYRFACLVRLVGPFRVNDGVPVLLAV